MAFFQFDGFGRRGGKKPTMIYEAASLDAAVNLASQDGMMVEMDTAKRVYPIDHFYTKVVGVSHEGRQMIISQCSAGEYLVLEHDRLNKFSAHAIAVYRRDGSQCGFLSDELAAPRVLEAMQNEATLFCVVTSVTGGHENEYFGLNIAIMQVADPETPIDYIGGYASQLVGT